jgi:hypothetical protein
MTTVERQLELRDKILAGLEMVSKNYWNSKSKKIQTWLSSKTTKL